MEKLDCAQFVLKVGLDAALKIFGEQVWDKAKLTFEQWSSLNNRIVNDRVFNTKIMAKLVETASTWEHWFQLWGKAPAESSLRQLIVEKIKEELKTLTTFDQVQRWRSNSLGFDFDGYYKELNMVWLDRLVEVASSIQDWKMVRNAALNSKYGNNDLAAKALTKMVDCAARTGTAEVWEQVYHETPVGSHTWQALDCFFKQATTFEDWHSVWYRARAKNNSDLAKIAWQKVVASASTFQEWRSVFWGNEENDAATKELCANKVRKLAQTFKDWSSLYTSKKIDSGIKADVLAQMLARAKTLDDWYDVWYWTPEGSVEKAQALEKVRSFVKLD